MSTYAIAKSPVPLFNTPNIPQLDKDQQGLIRSIETIALPHTKFSVLRQILPNTCEVTTVDYPSSTPLYVDSRFLQPAFKETFDRYKTLPPSATILKFMKSVVGVRYFWGGNWAQGIPEMAQLYPNIPVSDDLLCKGVDCSGLLYQATDGFTPRNTSQLCTYGQKLEVDLKSPEAVQKVVKPLDMMVWKGHVIFVLDSDHFIESVIEQGVVISDFTQRYTYFRDKLAKENKPFTLRRWHPDFLS